MWVPSHNGPLPVSCKSYLEIIEGSMGNGETGHRGGGGTGRVTKIRSEKFRGGKIVGILKKRGGKIVKYFEIFASFRRKRQKMEFFLKRVKIL